MPIHFRTLKKDHHHNAFVVGRRQGKMNMKRQHFKNLELKKYTTTIIYLGGLYVSEIYCFIFLIFHNQSYNMELTN